MKGKRLSSPLKHESFEELCVLVASGQASDEQRNEVSQHIASCTQCHEFLAATAGLSAELYAHSEDGDVTPQGAQGRFVARAISEGIPLRRPLEVLAFEKKKEYWGHLPLLVAAGVVLFLVCAKAAMSFVSGKDSPPSALPVPRLVISSPAFTPNPDTSVIAESEKAKAELALLKQELAQLRLLETQESNRVRELQAQNDALTAVLQSTQQTNKTLRASVRETTQDRDNLTEKLAQFQSDRTVEKVTAIVQQSEVTRLQEQIKRLEDELAEQESLVAQAREAQDLITARKLHLVDVHDADPNGKNEKAYGRIYYAEGKRLVFYAYDLADPRKVNKTFYLWGQGEGGTPIVHKLGVFHTDDPKDRRWVVRFDDPGTLAQVNMLFVTMEKRENVEQPGGKRILYAYLGAANHP